MSLLMDALRKAEETKRLQAEGASSPRQDGENIQCEAPDFVAAADTPVLPATNIQDSAAISEHLRAEHSTTTDSAAGNNHERVVTPVGEHTATVSRRATAQAHRSMSSFLLALEPLAIAPHDVQSASTVADNTIAARAVATEQSELETLVTEPFVETNEAGIFAVAQTVAETDQVTVPFAPTVTRDASVDDLMAEFDNEFGSHVNATQDPLAQNEIVAPAEMAPTHSTPQQVAVVAAAKQEAPRMESQVAPKAPSAFASKNTEASQQAKPENVDATPETIARSAPAKTTASPVTAAKIFNAAAKPKNAKTRMAAIFAATLVTLSAGGIYVYLEQQRLAMPMLAANFPPAANDEGATPTSAAVPASPIADVANVATEFDNSPPTSKEPPAEKATPATASAAKPIKPAHSETARADVTNTPEQEFEPAPLPVATKLKKKPENSTAQPVVVTTAPKVDPVLAAYAAFQQGDLALARDLYQSALRDDGNNRDALLGSAAIALRAGDSQYAKSLYERVLRQWPSDQVAAAGLLNVLGESEPLRAESELKYLLNDQSDSAALHFVLGNVYIRQQRWSDAETEFFSAYRLDRNNADFAYNLAVCLDHLGQRSAALEHYQAAQSLAKNTNSNFDRAVVERRIALLGDTQHSGVAP